jgi:protein-S-isoprenylcysteine O-methyltransferase Ste14/GNAT superfamily N-acetyltransferase
MRVRPATAQDANPAVEVVRESIRRLCRADHQDDAATLERWLSNKTPESFTSWLANPDNFCVVGEAQGMVRGVGLLHRSGELRLFYVAPGHQRSGMGTLIHAALERQAAAWGLGVLRLKSTFDARPFYEALGYRSAGAQVPLFGALYAYPYEKPVRPGKAVAVPPPFLFGAALVGGWIAHRTLGWPVPLPRAASIAAGAVLAAAGVALSAIVTWLFVRARTPISPLSQPTALVVEGPYRFTRNPDYIGQALLTLGVGLLLDAPAVVAAALAALLAVHRAVVPREEAFLEQRFGERYREYRARVPRWV